MQDLSQGCLYIIATPIGNLKDITLRALETLNLVDYILCEDTRETLKLLNHYNIKKHLESYFVGNEHKKADTIVRDIQQGKKIGLVTDGGTPCISDPGNYLVKSCLEKNIAVIPIPGVSALTTALSVSGMAEHISIFIGFLPKSRKKINKIMKKIANYDGNIILYESPYRLKKLLEMIYQSFGDVKIILCKELTKLFESIKLDNVKNILADINVSPIKGEYVVIFNKEIH